MCGDGPSVHLTGAPEPGAVRTVTQVNETPQNETRLIHWYDPQHKSWLTQNVESEWTGWSTTGTQLLTESPWTPWKSMLDQSDAPYQRWYSGAATNAAFNEIDRHVMDGFGPAAAIIEDQTGNES